MSAIIEEIVTHPLLEQARSVAAGQGLRYAGNVSPADAWNLAQAGAAVLVDVRSAEEHKFVGHVPGTVHVAWATGTSLTRNPRFERELEAKVGGKHKTVLLLCRSGQRSVLAAEALTKFGFRGAFNVLEGFEGERDPNQQRGALGGWRHHGLPWIQD